MVWLFLRHFWMPLILFFAWTEFNLLLAELKLTFDFSICKRLQFPLFGDSNLNLLSLALLSVCVSFFADDSINFPLFLCLLNNLSLTCFTTLNSRIEWVNWPKFFSTDFLFECRTHCSTVKKWFRGKSRILLVSHFVLMTVSIFHYFCAC